MAICKVPENITFSLTKDQNEYIQTMAKEIKACPVRSHGRAIDTIYNSVRKGVILEYALVAQGAIKNDATFDKTIPDSYCWDVIWDTHRTELKNVYFDKTMSWVSFNLKYVQTFINIVKRNKKLVDIIMFGHYDESGDAISVKWRLIAPSDTFPNIIRKCNPAYENNYDKKTGDLKYFYHHPSEKRSILLK